MFNVQVTRVDLVTGGGAAEVELGTGESGTVSPVECATGSAAGK